MSSYRMTRILKITVYSMFACFLALLNTMEVNELGPLSTVLKDYIPLHLIKTLNTDKFKISASVLYMRRPICLIRIDKKKHPDMLKLYFIPNTEIDWKKTIYIVSIFGQYAMINNPKTPEKLIKMFERMFEQIKRDFPDRKDVVQPIETQLSFLIEDLDNVGEFKTIDEFMESFKSPSVQSKPSTSTRVSVEKRPNTPRKPTISNGILGPPPPKSGAGIRPPEKSRPIMIHPNGTYSQVRRVRLSIPDSQSKTRGKRVKFVSPTPIPTPRKYRLPFIGWFFPNKKTVKNPNPWKK